MSLPARSSVWSASSLPGTAGSGICFTQTARFIGLLRSASFACSFGLSASGRADEPVAPPDDLILAAIRTPMRNVGTVDT